MTARLAATSQRAKLALKAAEHARARRRTLVYLTVLAHPGSTRDHISTRTAIPPKAVTIILRDLEHERLIITRRTWLPGGERGPVEAYPRPQPDATAAARLDELSPHSSRADIRSVA